jgi:hypothetical protein
VEAWTAPLEPIITPQAQLWRKLSAVHSLALLQQNPSIETLILTSAPIAKQFVTPIESLPAKAGGEVFEDQKTFAHSVREGGKTK